MEREKSSIDFSKAKLHRAYFPLLPFSVTCCILYLASSETKRHDRLVRLSMELWIKHRSSWSKSLLMVMIIRFSVLRTWQSSDWFLLVRTLLREPQVVEPFDDFELQMLRHAPHPHVGLDSVQFGCWKGEKEKRNSFEQGFHLCLSKENTTEFPGRLRRCFARINRANYQLVRKGISTNKMLAE